VRVDIVMVYGVCCMGGRAVSLLQKNWCDPS
jgi:hypothetical protein